MATRAKPPSHIQLPSPHSATSPALRGMVLRSQGYTTIDSFVLSNLLRPSFPAFLDSLIASKITRCQTPPLLWGGNPSYSPDLYEDMFKAAAYIGRAYTLLSQSPQSEKLDLNDEKAFPFTKLPVELRLQIYEHFEVRHQARLAIWAKVVIEVFTKAFFSGRDPEPAARYVAGLLILTCGYSLSKTPRLQGKGTNWCWMDNTRDADTTWNWNDLYTAVMKTETLSRDCTDWRDCRRRIEEAGRSGKATDLEYVPQQVLDVFDLARYRLRGGMRDLSVEQVLDMLPTPPAEEEEEEEESETS